MPVNPDLFPDDYPGYGLIGTELVDAVTQLRTEALNAARRQAHTRRIGGQMAIANQAQAVPTFTQRIPLHRVGPVAKAVPFAGSVAVLGGGRTYTDGYQTVVRTMYNFSFNPEVIYPLGATLSVQRTYPGTVGNATAGLFAGGDVVLNLDQYTYLTRQNARVAAQISVANLGLSGGINTRTKGLLCGGNAYPQATATRTVERVTFGLIPLVSTLANFLPIARSTPHNSICSPSFGYLYSGSRGNFFGGAADGTAIMSIERINHTTTPETTTTLGVTVTLPHRIHCCMSSQIKGYVATGSQLLDGFPYLNWFSDKITALTFSGDTLSTLGITLPDPRTCTDGVGHESAGYCVAGDSPSSGWEGSKTVDRISYTAPETTARIGAELTINQADQGGICDYGPGFSY